MNWDVPVLFGSVLAIVLSFVWDRATFVGPVLFAWAGAAAGGTMAFVRHYDKGYDQVSIVFIVSSAAVGAVLGLLLGFAVRAAYLDGSGRRKAGLEVLAATALFAGIGMVVGWIRNRFEDDAVPGLVRSAVVFAGIGALLTLVNCRLRKCRLNSASPTDTATL
jgi:hypothetical protein